MYPVVFYDHAWDAPDATRSLPIGRAEAVRVDGGALRMTLRFASADANPLAEQVFRLFREGMLHAVSVGWTARGHPSGVRARRPPWNR